MINYSLGGVNLPPLSVRSKVPIESVESNHINETSDSSLAFGVFLVSGSDA